MITEEIKDLFKDYPRIIKVLSTKPKNMRDIVDNYLPHKIWRMNNLYSVTAKPSGEESVAEKTKFRMNRAQFIVYRKGLDHPKIIILKARQQGISTYALVDFFDDALFIPNLDIGIIALNVDQTKHLLQRVKLMWSWLDPKFKELLKNSMGVELLKDNTGEISFTNNSKIQVRTEFRGYTLHRLHVSELAAITKASPERGTEIMRGTLQAIHANCPVRFEGTADGDNLFKYIYDNSTANLTKIKTGKLSRYDFLPIFLSWMDDPTNIENNYQEPTNESILYFKDKPEATQEQKNFWLAKRRTFERKEDMYREYPATPEEAFSASNEGAVYRQHYMDYVVRLNREKDIQYDERLPIGIGWDVGGIDCTVLFAFQNYMNKEIRIFDEFVYDKEGDIQFYADYIMRQKYGDKVKKDGLLFLPWDCHSKGFNLGGISIASAFNSLGFRVAPPPPKRPFVFERVEAVRQMTKILWLDINKCSYARKCFLYTSKKWNAAKQQWMDDENHDIYSHGSQALGEIALNYKKLKNYSGDTYSHRSNYYRHGGLSVS